MTDDDVEKIIKRNMNLQMNLAGIRADFEEAQQRTWVGLTLADKEEYLALDFGGNRLDAMDWADQRLKEKNT